MTNQNEDLMTMQEAIEYTKVTRGAIYAAITKGKLKAIKIGFFYRLSKRELDDYRLRKYNRDEREINGERIFDVEKGTFSVPQVSKIISDELKFPYGRQRIYHLIRTGQLRASRVGATFVIKREDLVNLIEQERQVKTPDYRHFKPSQSA